MTSPQFLVCDLQYMCDAFFDDYDVAILGSLVIQNSSMSTLNDFANLEQINDNAGSTVSINGSQYEVAVIGMLREIDVYYYVIWSCCFSSSSSMCQFSIIKTLVVIRQ
jgi:hypothetical protein